MQLQTFKMHNFTNGNHYDITFIPNKSKSAKIYISHHQSKNKCGNYEASSANGGWIRILFFNTSKEVIFSFTKCHFCITGKLVLFKEGL